MTPSKCDKCKHMTDARTKFDIDFYCDLRHWYHIDPDDSEEYYDGWDNCPDFEEEE